MKPQISVVAAISRAGAIGKGGKLLFHISDDLKRFKRLTKGHPVIMGRKTFESIGRALPDRRNIIVTRDRSYHVSGGEIAHSLEEALARAELRKPNAERRGNKNLPSSSPPFSSKGESSSGGQGGEGGGGEIFIIGGGEIFKQALPFCEKLYLTIVDSDAKGDVFFPDWRTDFTKDIFREERFDEKTGLKYTWVDLERNKKV